jgi:hypothetical protein
MMFIPSVSGQLRSVLVASGGAFGAAVFIDRICIMHFSDENTIENSINEVT